MADDVTIDNADLTDYTVASDEISGKHYQKAKAIDPTAESEAPIGVSGNPWHIQGAITQLNQLVPEIYDYIELGYTGSDLTTVTYKSGGPGGSTVATLTLAYSASVLQSVTKT